MLVKVIDKRGKERYINAMYVRAVVPKGPDEADLEFGGMSSKIRVREPAESIALTLNTAMPNSIEAALIAAEEQTQNEESLAIIAVIG